MGDEYVSVEHLFLSMLKQPSRETKELFREFGITPERFLQALSSIRGNQKVTSDNPEATYDTLEKYGYDLVERANKLFAQDIIGETQRLVDRYGWDNQAMKSNIYPIVWRMMRGEIDLEEAKRLSALEDWHLAKRQMTWFARNKDIVWKGLDEVHEYVYNVFR